MTNTKIKEQINKLKKKLKAVILVHNYVPEEVQAIGDYVGDSLGLSATAAKTNADCIIFCGVHFMAETAAILSPQKPVYMPDLNAGCPMANMVTEKQLRLMKKKHPDAIVITYVNSSAAIKAMSDICCTSANAVNVVKSVPTKKEVLFVPDRNLGNFVASQLQRKLILWDGFCPTHQRILSEHVLQSREKHPDALFVAHPECRPEVIKLADKVGSTTGIIRICQKEKNTEFIIGTEKGLLTRLKKENPDKKFFPASPVSDCPNMKLNSLEKVLWCLEKPANPVVVATDIAEKALRPIERMLEITGG